MSPEEKQALAEEERYRAFIADWNDRPLALDVSSYLGKPIHHNDYKAEPKIWAYVRSYLEGLYGR